jgi:hypothetical protein
MIMAEEFISYIKTTDIKNNKKAIEMLLFQWKQIKILSLSGDVKKTTFCWHKRFRLSKNACIKKLSFSPYEDDTNNTNTTYTIMYKNADDYMVYHFEITEFLYFYFNKLKLNTPIESLKSTSKKFNTNIKDVKKIVEPTLKQFAKNGVISVLG